MNEIIEILKSIHDLELLRVIIIGNKGNTTKNNYWSVCPCVFHAIDLSLTPHVLLELMKSGLTEDQKSVIQEEIDYRLLGWTDFGNANEGNPEKPYATKCVYPKGYVKKYDIELRAFYLAKYFSAAVAYKIPNYE